MYLTRYLNILSLAPFFSTIRIYDLFCGEGQYPNGGKGSPLVILDAVKSCLEVNARSITPSKFICHFNDAKPEKALKAQEAVANAKYEFPEQWVRLKFSQEEYSSIARNAINQIEASRDTRAFVSSTLILKASRQRHLAVAGRRQDGGPTIPPDHAHVPLR
ncbi:MAG: hypothetical protein IPN38_15590 [Flavobacteriales bacterium]|nr:hypothetical protein [Flavobacteriales bacterium]